MVAFFNLTTIHALSRKTQMSTKLLQYFPAGVVGDISRRLGDVECLERVPKSHNLQLFRSRLVIELRAQHVSQSSSAPEARVIAQLGRKVTFISGSAFEACIIGIQMARKPCLSFHRITEIKLHNIDKCAF